MSNESKEDREKREAESAKKKAQEERRGYVARVMNPATYGIAAGTITDPDKLGDVFVKLRSGGVNLLAPETHLGVIPRNYVVSLKWCFIDRMYPEPGYNRQGKEIGNGLWYPQGNDGYYSLNIPALHQLGSTANIQWGDFDRTDDGREPLLWRYVGRASVTLFDGSPRNAITPGESDLREGSAESKQIDNATQLAKARAKGSQRCVSILKGAIIRELLGLRQKYSTAEADMPFVWPALVFMPPADPEIDRLMAMKELGLLGAIYGGRREVIDIEPRMLPAPGADPVDYAAENARLATRERVPVGESAAPPVAAPAPQRAPAVTDPDAPPFEAPPVDPDRSWGGYTLDEVTRYSAWRKWPEPLSMSPAEVTRFCAWLTSDKGGADIRSYLGRK